MKRFASIAVLLLLLAGCAQTPAASPSVPPTDKTTPQTETGFAYTYKSVPITLGAKADDFIAAAGEPTKVFESPSCAFEGIDKILYYPGFVINTYPDNGVDFILSVVFEDDSVKTPEGIFLGSSAADVESKYGKAQTSDATQLKYVKGDTSLTFLLEDGAVSDISYRYTKAGV
ncbi:hypothetical protein FACS1894217_00670 [Clostridia bacterium]|nr:hypothetical protein FACS1894217_00670 [Clostridia bacterium]